MQKSNINIARKQLFIGIGLLKLMRKLYNTLLFIKDKINNFAVMRLE